MISEPAATRIGPSVATAANDTDVPTPDLVTAAIDAGQVTGVAPTQKGGGGSARRTMHTTEA